MSPQTRWKLLALLIVALTILGTAGWQQFALKPVHSGYGLNLSQTCSSKEARLGQVVDVVISAENNGEEELATSSVLLNLPLGFEVLKTNVVYPNGTRISGLSIGAEGELTHAKLMLKPNQKLTVSLSLNTTLESRTSNFTTTIRATYESGGILGIGTETVAISKTAQTTIRVPLEAWYSVLREIRDDRWLKYAVASNLCIEDAKLRDIEEKYLLRPTQENAYRVITDYISDMTGILEIGPVLATELQKIPDFAYDNKTVEALEDILQLARKPSHRRGFLSMLSEGIPDERAYCTPLQALLWYAYDFEFNAENGPLVDTPLELVRVTWLRSFMYDYRSDRWKSFEEVVDRLNSPDLVSIYTRNNIRYVYYSPPTWYRPAQVIFQEKRGICVDFATFQSYMLKANGYDAWNVGLAIETATGHNVCGYKCDGLWHVLDNYGVKKGPFKSLEQLADSYIRDCSITLWNPFDITYSTLDSLSLRHTVYRSR